MSLVGPSTPVGTRCLFIGPTIAEYADHIGSEIVLVEHLIRGTFKAERLARLSEMEGHPAPEAIVCSGPEYALVLYQQLIRLDPDHDQFNSERNHELITEGI